MRIVLMLTVLLAGCGGAAYREADYKALCDPNTGKAYLVTPNTLDASFVKPAPQFDALCKR
jgi:hypothetical protein